MVSAKSLGTDYNATGIYIPSFSPGTRSKKTLYILDNTTGSPVLKTDVFAFYLKREGKMEVSPEVMETVYSLYNRLSGYIRRIQFLPPVENRRKYPALEILIEDDGDGDFFKIEAFADSAASTSLCSSLLDPRADFSQPFIFTAYKKEDKAKNQVYVNVPITQSHLPPRKGGYNDNLYCEIKKQLPTRWDAKLNKNLPDWFSSDWSLISDIDSKYHGKPILLGIIEYLDGKVVAAKGKAPSEEELLAKLRGAPVETNSPDYGDYEDEEEEVDTSFFSAFNAYPVATPQPTPRDELAPFFDKLDWGDAEKTAFYSKYGESNTPSLKAIGKLEAAKEYLSKMEEIYAISATLLPAMGATDEDKAAISKMAAFVASKGVLGLNVIDATLQKAKDLKAAQMDPFAVTDEAEVAAPAEDIPF